MFLPSAPAGIARYPVAGALYDVQLSEQGLVVRREGKPLFDATTPVEIRKVEFHRGAVRCEVRASRPGQLKIGAGTARPYIAGLTRCEGRYK